MSFLTSASADADDEAVFDAALFAPFAGLFAALLAAGSPQDMSISAAAAARAAKSIFLDIFLSSIKEMHDTSKTEAAVASR
jgi:hypothetical protein